MRKERGALLRWYHKHRRDLPWRRTEDPYAIWISEAMLQQTRVETVLPYYTRFLEAFPSLDVLADAETESVLEIWSGLGYYSRARNLQKAAQEVVERFGGELPEQAESLRSLPGIGRYTAGAVASIAFDRPEPIVDGNIVRVFTRFLGIREDVKSQTVIDELWATAETLVRGSDPGDLNQALMELGATLCTPRKPNCSACPIRKRCNAHQNGDAESIPVKKKRKPSPLVTAVAALLERRGKYLMVRRSSEGLLGGLWELPGGPVSNSDGFEATLKQSVRKRLGLEIGRLKESGTVSHIFSHRRLQLHVFRGKAASGSVRRHGYDAHRWLSASQLEQLAQSSVAKKALSLAQKTEDRDSP